MDEQLKQIGERLRGLREVLDIPVEDVAALCGITEDELRTQMKPEFEAMVQTTGKTFEQVCAGLKQKYDGYHFSEKSPDIYKPFR